jgi:hypothetical protein
MGDEKEQNGRKLIGTLEPFVVGESDFDDYLSIVDNYFELNHVEEDNYKVRLLVNMIGSTASTKIIKAFKPVEIGKVKYPQLIEKCKKLFSVEKNAIMEHFKFNNRAQKPGEGLSDYAIELQSLAEHCSLLHSHLMRSSRAARVHCHKQFKTTDSCKTLNNLNVS